MHRWYSNAAHAVSAHHWSSCSGPSVSLMHVMRSWGSSPSLAMTSSSSLRHTWVLTLCVIPCCIMSRKVEAFTLVALHSSSLPVGIHCACISRDLVARTAKTYQRWSSLSGMMQLRRSQFSRVCWKDGERVICVFWVPVIDGQADGCCSSCQCMLAMTCQLWPGQIGWSAVAGFVLRPCFRSWMVR